MTRIFFNIYQYFKRHQFQMWFSMVLLFLVTGYGAACIHLEEDLNKLMPSSRNADGSIKTAFADLRIKDKTYLLRQFQRAKVKSREPAHQHLRCFFRLAPGSRYYRHRHFP